VTGRVAEAVGWSAVSCGIWLVTLSGVTLPELLFAIGSSIPCGVLAVVARRSMDASWRFRAGWLLWVAPVVATLAAETVALARATVLGPEPGSLEPVELPPEPDELTRGRSAAATLAFCSTPGSIVAHNDPEQHRLLVHSLLSAGPDLPSVVGR
jgi:hypothetical protein